MATATRKPRATGQRARRDEPSHDLDAERWLDEGGRFSSKAVMR
jgi:hypothetical protein